MWVEPVALEVRRKRSAVVRRGIPFDVAPDALVDLVKENGMFAPGALVMDL